MNQPRAFLGIWIPAEVWNRSDISLSEKCLLVEIQSLDQGEGCYASDDYLSSFMGISSGRLRNILVSLRDRGLVETIGFNGRKRMLRQTAFRVIAAITKTLHLHENVTAGVTETLQQVSLFRDTSSNIEESKDENKGKKESVTLSDEVWMSDLTFNTAYLGIDVEREFQKCKTWCETNRKHASRKRFINWLNRIERPMNGFHKPAIPGGRPPSAPIMR